MTRALLLGFSLASAACSHATTSAPAPEPAGPIYRFKIGALDAVALADGAFHLPNDGKMVGVDHSPSEIGDLLAAAGLPRDRIDIDIHPLLVKDGAHVLLFDTGLGEHGKPTGGNLPQALAAAGVAPGDVTDIFISHMHGDHVGGLVTAAGALAFPNAAIHMSAPEWAAMQADDDAKKIATAIAPKVAPFEPDAQLLPEVTAVATPGHTPGHSSYEIASGGEKLFYLGDVAHHWVISLAHPSWTIGFDRDKPAAQAMRQQTLAKLAAAHERVFAVHFPFPGLGYVSARGDGFAWDASK